MGQRHYPSFPWCLCFLRVLLAVNFLGLCRCFLLVVDGLQVFGGQKHYGCFKGSPWHFRKQLGKEEKVTEIQVSKSMLDWKASDRTSCRSCRYSHEEGGVPNTGKGPILPFGKRGGGRQHNMATTAIWSTCDSPFKTVNFWEACCCLSLINGMLQFVYTDFTGLLTSSPVKKVSSWNLFSCSRSEGQRGPRLLVRFTGPQCFPAVPKKL